MLERVDRALLLARAPLFGRLDEAALLELAGAATLVEVAPGGALAPDALYLVVAGGLEQRGRRLGPGELFGERGVLGAPDEDAVAATGATVLRIEADDLLDAIALEPALAADLCARLAGPAGPE